MNRFNRDSSFHVSQYKVYTSDLKCKLFIFGEIIGVFFIGNEWNSTRPEKTSLPFLDHVTRTFSAIELAV